MKRYLFVLVLLSGCNEDCGCELINEGFATDRGELEEFVIGRSMIGNCFPEGLSLDPSWTPEEQEILRVVSLEWKDAIGIDLGELPVNDSCIWDPYSEVTENCILRADRSYSEEMSSNTIRLYHDTICEYGDNYFSMLKAAALHEMGHWIGLRHLNNSDGIMFKELRNVPIANADINLYEETCE